MKRTLLIGMAIGAIVALLALLLLLPPGRGHNTTEASGGSGASPTIFGVDVEPHNTVSIIDGLVDIDADGGIDGDDDGDLGGYDVIDGYLDIDGDGATPPDTDDDGAVGGYDVIDGYLDIDDDGATPPDTHDDATLANTATSLAAIDSCIQVESIESGPGVPGPIFDVDVFLDDVSSGKDLAGADFYMYYEKDYLQVNGWSGATGAGCSDWLLKTQPGSGTCLEVGDKTFPDTDGTLNVSMADPSGVIGAEQAGALGVLNRYEMQVVQPGPKFVAITFAGAPTYLATSAPARYDSDQVLTATIAIDQPCSAATATPTATPTPTPTGTPTPGMTNLAAGWNYACYIDAAQPIQDALTSISDGLLAVYRLRPDQGYDKWFPNRPDVSTMTTVGSYESLLLLMSSSRSWSQNAAASPPASHDLVQGWNSVCYLGQTKEMEAATASIAGKFSIIYTLAPDQSWKRFVPGRPQISNLASLQQFSSVLTLVTQAEGAQWVFDP